MLKRVLVAALVGVLALPAAPALAGGHPWFHGHATKEACPIGWTEKTVTAYRVECKTRVVPVTANRVVQKVVEEPYQYTELVPVTVAEKRAVTTYQCVTKQVPFTYTVQVPVVVPEKRIATTYQCVAREVPFTYSVKVPVVIPEKRTITTFVSVPEEICKQVEVRKLAWVSIEDPCTGCSKKKLKHVSYSKPVKTVVWHKVPQTKEVIVNVCSYRFEERTGTKLVHEKVARAQEITVNVCSYKPEERTGSRTVVEKVPVTQEITVHVAKCQAVQRTGTVRRIVCETVPETIDVTQSYRNPCRLRPR
ncbi:MAG: hypothetical protein K2R98_18400 [Gemmataceae bacterium]|nr:hypothetical protein [Gemmataceae bacterium]